MLASARRGDDEGNREEDRSRGTVRGESLPSAEVELVRRLREGDAEAYELLVRGHADRLLVVARALLGDSDAARDVVQETFVAVLEHIGDFRHGSRLGTWLHRITVNAALMRLRRGARRQEIELEPLLPAFDTRGRHVRPVRPWPPAAEDRLLRSEVGRQVRSCVRRLPRDYRVVVVLRDLQELDTATTARLLGVTPNAVKIRLHRARQALAELLRRELFDSENE